MKYTYLLLCTSLVFLFVACNDFDLNAPYKDVTVVYGILDYKLDTNFVKIYKGFQSRDGATFINARTPDSIYYNVNDIIAILEEYKDNKRTLRPNIPLKYTDEFKRDTGIFYYEKEKIIYYTTEKLLPDADYKIVITNKKTKKITTGQTSIVGDFEIKNYMPYPMPAKTDLRVDFTPSARAFDYEIHVSFLYFEVDKATNKVVNPNGKIVKNITPRLGEKWEPESSGNLVKKFTPTFYNDIATQLNPNPKVIRYMGTPGSKGVCIEIEAWAAEENLVKFLLSNQPTTSFVQINTRYTNMETSDGLAFGFLSSRVKAPVTRLAVTLDSQDSLIYGKKTSHLGFKPWAEYKP